MEGISYRVWKHSNGHLSTLGSREAVMDSEELPYVCLCLTLNVERWTLSAQLSLSLTGSLRRRRMLG